MKIKSSTNEKGADWGTFHQWEWNDIYCHWRDLGDRNNPPILLIHGFGASCEHWRNNAKNLAEAGFCIYGIDLIGFGKSEQPCRNKRSSLDNLFWAKLSCNFWAHTHARTLA